MNAYYEIFGDRVSKEALKEMHLKESEYKTFGTDSEGYILVAPAPHTKIVKDFIDNILWSKISCESTKVSSKIILKSKRTFEDEQNFINWLLNTNYCEDCGIRELFGLIVFKDNTWLERYECNGFEYWVKKVYPKEPNWDSTEL